MHIDANEWKKAVDSAFQRLIGWPGNPKRPLSGGGHHRSAALDEAAVARYTFFAPSITTHDGGYMKISDIKTVLVHHIQRAALAAPGIYENQRH
jgi:hypothetical protein